MSSESLPITPAAFAEAIKELTLPTLYAKVAELRNSSAHLQRSNQELQTFVSESCDKEADKRELEGYIAENGAVMESMNERIQMCKAEVERRGQLWIELDAEVKDETTQEGQEERTVRSEDSPTTSMNGTTALPARPRGGEDDGGEDGVYL
ncbi:hypothetical protein BDW59DRAFT_157461 [Aspergillus cavernicola]|uniref:Uncharacterized protein n=1 Tax=Aspergillus cavernicola TaxID=176166 RepID=A0ABR4IXH3_9EURO